MWSFPIVTFIALAAVVQSGWTQEDDPQDIAELACASSDSIYEFNSTSGYIESLGYPGLYESNEKCKWYINPAGGIPDGENLFLEIVWFNTEDFFDPLYVYEGEVSLDNVLFVLEGKISEGVYYDLGNTPATLSFTSDDIIERTGFRLYFYTGERSPACNATSRPAVLTNNLTTLIESPGYPFGHDPNIECEWVIAPETSPEGLYLGVLDYTTFNELQIYYDDNGAVGDTIIGPLDNGYTLYAPSSAMTLLYDVFYNDFGFKLVAFPADSACLSGSGRVIPITDNGGLTSPGYPFVIPEHLACTWFLEAEAGQKVTLTSLDMDIRGDGGNCQDEYVEIFDGEGIDALSLGRFCEDSFGTLVSTGEMMQIYFRSHDNPLGNRRAGFIFTYGATY